MITVEEWSNAFDVLVDSYRRFKSYDSKLELDSIEYSEYEKSLYLTLALEDIIKELYGGLTTYFEIDEKTRRELDALIKTSNGIPMEEKSLKDSFIHNVYKLPLDCWFIVYESAGFLSDYSKCQTNKEVDVVPTTHDEYLRVIRNPFRGPNNNRVLRIDSGNLQVELVSKYNLKDYTIRYISRPEPIILCDLTGDGIKIQDVDTPLSCKLSSSIHQEILNRAVKLALTNRINNTNKAS